MGSDGWRQRLKGGQWLSIRRIENAGEGLVYAVDLPGGLDNNISNIQATEAQLIDTSQSPSDFGSLRLEFAVPDSLTLARVRLTFSDYGFVLFLPSAEFLAICEEIRDGSIQATSKVIPAVGSAVQFVITSGAFHEIPEFIELIEGVAKGHGSSQLHSYRYAIIRSGLTPGPGPTIESEDDLETLVDGLNAIDEIGEVDCIDALGDVMATVHSRAKNTDTLLSRIGIESQELEHQQDGFFFVAYLAHIVVTEGFNAAEATAMRRTWRIGGDYKRRRKKAKNAEFSERGEAWRSLVCAAARKGIDEFAYVLANAFYWSSKVKKPDGRVDDLLLQGAFSIAQEIGLERIEARAEFEKLSGAGHRLRSSHNYRPAVIQFKRAEQLAATHDFLPQWHARHSRGICQSHHCLEIEDTNGAIRCLEGTIDDLTQFDIHDDRLFELTQHLEAQKYERLGDFSGNPKKAVQHYEDAIDLFGSIEFERSLDRCRKKKNQYADRLESHADSQPENPTGSGDTAREEQQACVSTNTENSGTEVREVAASTNESQPDEETRDRGSGFLRELHHH